MRETSFFESRFFQSVLYSVNDGGKKEEVSAESKPTVYGRVPAGRNCAAFAADTAAKAVRLARGGVEKRYRGFAARQSRRLSNNKRAKSKAHKAPYSFERRECRPACALLRALSVFRRGGRGLCASLPPPFAKGGQTRFVQEYRQNGTFDKPQFCRAVMSFGTCLRCDVCRTRAERVPPAIAEATVGSPRRLWDRRGDCGIAEANVGSP